MFETLSKAPPDKILALMAEFRADKRPEKIDLGVGVYRDETGNTPIMSAVRKAERRIFENQTTKTYVGIAGNKGYCEAVASLALAGSVPAERLRVVQTPGGTGALWVLMTLANRARPGANIFVSDPSWPNHPPIAGGAGLRIARYPYFDPATRSVRFGAMLDALETVGRGDLVLLHGCCHNPTGANLTPEQWDRVAEVLARTGATPLVDLAYQGFGDGLDADAYGARKLAATLPEVLIAFSASKNFGLYRERVGAAMVVSRDAEAADTVMTQLMNIARGCYSQPPDHGAEIVRLVLTDPDLRAEWEAELATTRNRMIRLREKLAEAIRQKSNAHDFDFLARHRGMFSLLGLGPETVAHLKASNAIYMIGDSRINVAGIPEDRVEDLAEALLAAVK